MSRIFDWNSVRVLCPGVGAVTPIYPRCPEGRKTDSWPDVDRLAVLDLRPTSGIWNRLYRPDRNPNGFGWNVWGPVDWYCVGRGKGLVGRAVAELRLSGRFAVCEEMIEEAFAETSLGEREKAWATPDTLFGKTNGDPANVNLLTYKEFVELLGQLPEKE